MIGLYWLYIDCVDCTSIVSSVFELCRWQGFCKKEEGVRNHAMLSHKWHLHNSRPRPFLTQWSANIYPWQWHKKGLGLQIDHVLMIFVAHGYYYLDLLCQCQGYILVDHWVRKGLGLLLPRFLTEAASGPTRARTVPIPKFILWSTCILIRFAKYNPLNSHSI